jgi:hypothetical protein
MQFSPDSNYFILLGSKCFPQCHVVRHPQSVFFP